jgi:transposase
MRNRIPVFVGLDYGSQAIQVAVLESDGRLLGSRRVANATVAVTAYAARFGRVVRAAVEAGNGTAALADELRERFGWLVQLAHPGYVRRMKQNPDKSDYSDARLLADLCRVGYVPPVWLAPPAIRELRRLVRHRQALVDQGRAVKLRVAALLRDHRLVRPAELKRTWTRRHRDWLQLLLSTELVPPISRQLLADWLADLGYLEGRIARAETQLQQAVASEPLVDWLLAQPCVGLVTACVLRAEVGCFERFRTGKQLARYCGLTPRNASSGQRQADAGLIHAGNSVLKATLIELAHRLMVHVPTWQALRVRLRAAGKAPCVIVAAVANRWVRRLLYEVRTRSGMAAGVAA